jgi:hypothetical protein
MTTLPESSNSYFTTTPVGSDDSPSETPEERYNRYANTTPPFPLFPNVNPPVYSQLSPTNTCNTAVQDYTDTINKINEYFKQESFIPGIIVPQKPKVVKVKEKNAPLSTSNLLGKLTKNNNNNNDNNNNNNSNPTVIVKMDPVTESAKVVQQAMNASNNSSITCVCNNVATTVTNNSNSSEAIEFDMSDIVADNFNLTVGQTSKSTTTVTNVLSESFTNTVNNTVKNNLNIFASQVNKVKNASPDGLGNSQKFFNAIQNSLMDVVNNNTVANTANTQFQEKNSKITLTNIKAKNINIKNLQNTVTTTYVKSVVNAITNNAMKNIGINTAGITAAMENTVTKTKPQTVKNNTLIIPGDGGEDGEDGEDEAKNPALPFLLLIPYFILYFGIIFFVYYMSNYVKTNNNSTNNSTSNPTNNSNNNSSNYSSEIFSFFKGLYENHTFMIMICVFTAVYGICLFGFTAQKTHLDFLPGLLTILLDIVFIGIVLFDKKHFKILYEDLHLDVIQNYVDKFRSKKTQTKNISQNNQNKNNQKNTSQNV